MGCNHLWNANDGKGGEPCFQVRDTGNKPVMRASCPKCYARAWFTVKEWSTFTMVKAAVAEKPPAVPKKRGGK